MTKQVERMLDTVMNAWILFLVITMAWRLLSHYQLVPKVRFFGDMSLIVEPRSYAQGKGNQYSLGVEWEGSHIGFALVKAGPWNPAPPDFESSTSSSTTSESEPAQRIARSELNGNEDHGRTMTYSDTAAPASDVSSGSTDTQWEG